MASIVNTINISGGKFFDQLKILKGWLFQNI